jgi:heat shock protein HtpX
MYTEIEKNRRNSGLLIALFIGLFSAVGYAYGVATQTGYSGLVFAFVFSLGGTALSWFAGDTVVLATTGAEKIEEKTAAPELWNILENLSITAGISMPALYLIEDPSPNAFATGRDPAHASVAVTTGLLQRLNRSELEGVLAHELSHVKNYDTRWLMLVAVLIGSISLLGDWAFRGSLFRRRSDDDRSSSLGFFIGIALLILAPIVGQLIKFAISRQREYLADASGALLTRYPEGLASALEKIRDSHIPVERAPSALAHLWISAPSASETPSWHARASALFSTHPPIDDRIHRLRTMGR